MKIAYVILHYMAGKETIECAKSILDATKASEHQTRVIIVDNGSPNDSCNEIKRVFANNDQIVILHSDENLGFARGNNIGFRYAKEQYRADFIVQLNNDTILTQTDFNEVLVRKYEEKQYAVLGPDIVTLDGYHQNPVPKELMNFKQLKIYRIKKYIKIVLLILNVEKIVRDRISLNKDVYRKATLPGDVEDAFLHGACYIFSPQYIEVFDGMYEKTFLYWEEDILKLTLDHHKMKALYSSDLSLLHKEDVATVMMKAKTKKRNIWMEKQLIRSSRVYENVYRETMRKTENHEGGTITDKRQ